MTHQAVINGVSRTVTKVLWDLTSTNADVVAAVPGYKIRVIGVYGGHYTGAGNGLIRFRSNTTDLTNDFVNQTNGTRLVFTSPLNIAETDSGEALNVIVSGPQSRGSLWYVLIPA